MHLDVCPQVFKIAVRIGPPSEPAISAENSPNHQRHCLNWDWDIDRWGSWNYMKFIEIRQTVKHSLGFCWRFDLLQIGYSLLDVVGALLQWIRKASNLLDGEAVRNVKTPLPPWHFYGLSNTSFGDFNVYTCSYPILAVIRVTARWWAVWGYARYG